MSKIRQVGWMSLCIFLLASCQSASVPGRSGSGESQYEEKQSREAYIHSPAYVNVQLGVEYMRRGDMGLALSKLRKALVQSPQLAIAHNTIAVLYERIGEYDLAGQHFERSISLDPNDSRLRNNYGRYLCYRKFLKQALEQFDIAAANPLYQTPYLPMVNAGICALGANDLELADRYLRDALKRQPKLVPALLSMTVLSVRQERYQQGKAYMQRYLGMAKHNKESLWAGYQIEKNLGNKGAANNYAVRLKTRYPDSGETRQLLEAMNTR